MGAKEAKKSPLKPEAKGLGQTDGNAGLKEPRVDFDEVFRTMHSYQSTVEKWLKEYSTTRNCSFGGSSRNGKLDQAAGPASSITDSFSNTGRPARLGLGAKPKQQAKNLDSVLENQILKQKLTGATEITATFSRPHLSTTSKKMSSYSAKSNKRSEASRYGGDQDDGEAESRSKSIGAGGKRPSVLFHKKHKG